MAWTLGPMIVSGIDAEQLGHPSPCPKHDMAGLIDDLVEAGRRAVALGRGQAPTTGDGSPHMELRDHPSGAQSVGDGPAGAHHRLRAQQKGFGDR